MEPLVEHEFVHALGLTNHFDGFGQGSGGNCNGAICTDRTYPVLKALYANPPMTVISNMTIARKGLGLRLPAPHFEATGIYIGEP